MSQLSSPIAPVKRGTMKTRTLLSAFCLFLVVSVPRLLSLDAHWSSDEARWLRRSAAFRFAVKQSEFSETLIAHHPGVTTMWLAGLRTFSMEPRVDVPNLARARWFIGIVGRNRYTSAEIGEILGIPENTVKSRKRAIKKRFTEAHPDCFPPAKQP